MSRTMAVSTPSRLENRWRDARTHAALSSDSSIFMRIRRRRAAKTSSTNCTARTASPPGRHKLTSAMAVLACASIAEVDHVDLVLQPRIKITTPILQRHSRATSGLLYLVVRFALNLITITQRTQRLHRIINCWVSLVTSVRLCSRGEVAGFRMSSASRVLTTTERFRNGQQYHRDFLFFSRCSLLSAQRRGARRSGRGRALLT